MLSNQCPPICPHGERPESPAATIARLQKEVSDLRQQLVAKSVASGDAVAANIAATVAAEQASSKFVPLAATNCFGVKPCLHTTVASRLAAGCPAAVFEGHYGDQPTRYEKWQLNANLSVMKPVAPSDRGNSRFHPVIGEQCDLSDVWSVAKAVGHITDATEAHWHRRLRGLKDSLWLSIGSSIDHDAMKEACGQFGVTRLAVEAKPSAAYPLPSPLIVDYCHIARLNLTLGFVAANGIATTWLQRNASLQHTRFREIGAQLRRLTPPFYGPPTFLTLGGMEWDFKNWRYEHEWADACCARTCTPVPVRCCRVPRMIAYTLLLENGSLQYTDLMRLRDPRACNQLPWLLRAASCCPGVLCIALCHVRH